MKLDVHSVSRLTEEARTELLKKLIERLDELDCEDFFGTEGWEHYLLGGWRSHVYGPRKQGHGVSPSAIGLNHSRLRTRSSEGSGKPAPWLEHRCVPMGA